jgi:hypothetical protein
MSDSLWKRWTEAITAAADILQFVTTLVSQAQGASCN